MSIQFYLGYWTIFVDGRPIISAKTYREVWTVAYDIARGAP